MKKKVIVSFSGGRTSAYMAYKMQFSPEFSDFEKHYLFSNTGKEREETLRFVEDCDKEFGLNVTWIESVITQEKGVGVSWAEVNFKTASRNGEPFSDMVQKFGIPNKDFPHCTRELKQRPMEKWASENFGKDILWAIGFRADERVRATANPQRLYPLIQTWPTNERMVREFWSKMPFDLKLRDYEGNCDLCWKKSMAKRLTILKENPGIERQWQEWEDSGEYVFDRDGFLISDLVTISKRNIARSVDKLEVWSRQPDLFGIDISRESKCHCG